MNISDVTDAKNGKDKVAIVVMSALCFVFDGHR